MKNNQGKKPEQRLDKTLWSDENKTRHFLIQDNIHLPLADFEIHTATGRTRKVDPEAIKEFEISKEEANAWLKDQFKTVMGQLKTGLKASLFSSSSQNDSVNENKQHKADSAENKKSATPGLDLLADITGTPRKRMDNNYSAIGQALKADLKDMTSTVADAVSGEPEQQESAREKMNAWRETLRKHDIKVPDAKENKPDNNNG